MTRTPDHDLHALLAEEPFVRGLACALAGSDGDDVAQQTYLMALQHGGRVEQPRSWLRRVATNLAANMRRGERRRGERERAAARRELVPSSAELMEREERRSALVRAVDALPRELREVVLLRWFEGMEPRQCAVELGLPVTTVWNRLRTALQRLRERLDAEHGGDRRAWLLPLLRWHPSSVQPVPALPVLLTGAWAMTNKTKAAVVVGVMLLLAGGYAFWPDDGAVGSTSPVAAAAMVTAPVTQPVAVAAAPATAPERVLVASERNEAATTGELVVRVVRADDRTAIPEQTLVLARKGESSPLAEAHHRTDEQGRVHVRALAPGKLKVSLLQYPFEQFVEIEAGQVTEYECAVPSGVAVRGIVVDADDRPVAGAEVDLFHFQSYCADTVAVTDAEGRFVLQHVSPLSLIGARSTEHEASRLQSWNGSEGGAVEVKIQLMAAGGTLSGAVWDPAGWPVVGARVRVGLDLRSGPVTSMGIDPANVPARTDGEGRFRIVGLKPGEHPVFVRAEGLAPWKGQCVITARAGTALRVDLGAGATVTGVVRDENGAPLADVDVSAGLGREFAHAGTETAGDGTFKLTGLAPGELEVSAWHQSLGETKAVVAAVAGATVSCDMVLSRGLELRGCVLSEAGEPQSAVMVFARAGGASASGKTDAEGRFTLINCPKGLLTVTAYRDGTTQKVQRENVDPQQGEVELRLHAPARPAASVRIRGELIGPDGRPAPGVTVSAYAPKGEGPLGAATAEDGSFTLGPVPPGKWKVYVPAQRFPAWVSEWRELAADAVWDLGRVQLEDGGTALVEVIGAPAGKQIDFSIRTGARPRGSGHWISERVLRTWALAPGDYEVWLACAGCARKAFAFTIRSGQETRVEARLDPGIRQRIEYRRADGAKLTGRLSHSLRRGDEVVIEDGMLVYWRGDTVYTPDGGVTAELWLVPGTYRIAARDSDQGVAGTAEFTVGDSEGPPARLVLK